MWWFEGGHWFILHTDRKSGFSRMFTRFWWDINVYRVVYHFSQWFSFSFRYHKISISHKHLICSSRYAKFSIKNLSRNWKTWCLLCNVPFTNFQSKAFRIQIGWKRLPICSSDSDFLFLLNSFFTLFFFQLALNAWSQIFFHAEIWFFIYIFGEKKVACNCYVIITCLFWINRCDTNQNIFWTRIWVTMLIPNNIS